MSLKQRHRNGKLDLFQFGTLEESFRTTSIVYGSKMLQYLFLLFLSFYRSDIIMRQIFGIFLKRNTIMVVERGKDMVRNSKFNAFSGEVYLCPLDSFQF